MSHYKYRTEKEDPEDQEIKLLKEWLLRLSGEERAYIKGAARALGYAQEENSGVFACGNVKLKEQCEKR